MKVFKFYFGDEFWAYSGKTEDQAKNQLFEDVGVMNLDKIEEIPESEWDKKIIDMYEDNDMENECWKVSIRDLMCVGSSHQIFTNESF